MSHNDKINAYIYTGLPDAKKDDFIQRIKIRNPVDIISIVCEMLQIKESDIKSSTRKREVVEARYIAMTLISVANPEMKLKAIGEIFNRDHSTVLYARETYNKLIASDKTFQGKVALIKQKV
jgi:chromosomal replication initiator protein